MEIQKEREALIAEIEKFKEEALKMYFIESWSESYRTDPFSYAIDDENKIIWMKAQARQLWDFWQQAQKAAVPETPKRQGGYYIRDLRRQSGNSMRFWYQAGYGTKHKNFFWCATLEEAKKYKGGCDWFEIWHAPYIDSLIEHTVDFQLADRSVGFVDLKAQEQTDISKFDSYVPMQSRKEQA